MGELETKLCPGLEVINPNPASDRFFLQFSAMTRQRFLPQRIFIFMMSLLQD